MDDECKSNIVCFFRKVIDDKIQKDINKDTNYMTDTLHLGILNDFTALGIDALLNKVSTEEFEKLGLDSKTINFSVLNYNIILPAHAVRHIYNGHGAKGYGRERFTDHNMSDELDYGNLYYVLQNHDNIKISRIKNKKTESLELNLDMQYQGSNGKGSIVLEIEKIVDEYWFIIIVVVPNNKKKQLMIKTAYKKKIKKEL